mgnify:FL=1
MLVPATRVASSSTVVVVPLWGVLLLLLLLRCCSAMVSQAERRRRGIKGWPGRVEGSEEGGVVVPGGRRLLLLPIAVVVVVVRVLRLAVLRRPRRHDGQTASERTRTRSDGPAGADSHSAQLAV